MAFPDGSNPAPIVHNSLHHHEYSESNVMIGLVLAGGKSSRLGQDKTRLVHKGQTLLHRTVTLLRRHCSQVYVSCRHPETVPEGIPVILDSTHRIGPAGGLITALRELNSPIFALACDLPFMEDRFIVDLLTARANRPPHCVMTAWRQQDSGFIEALVAIYEPQALQFLEKGLDEGKYKLSRLVPEELRHTVTYGAADSRFFFNVNYPKDLDHLTTT